MFKANDTPVPGYRLTEKLGRGQYGVVWAAEGPGGTRVALKFIPIEDAKGEIELKAIRYVKLIRHANLVPIHAVWLLDKDGNQLDGQMLNEAVPATEGETLVADPLESNQDLAYLIVCMTLADGSLDDKLKSSKKEGKSGLPLEEVVEYMQQTARGLDFLNEKRHQVGNRTVGIQHRDIKPANLLLIGDTVVIGDFGVATTMKNFHHTATTALGSLAFMAPESIAKRPSASSDQYALAITYYQLRTGELPFDPAATLPELIDIHKHGKLDFRGITVPEQKVLRKGTHKDPAQRFKSCRELSDALSRAVDSKARVAQGPAIGLPIAIAALVLALLAIPFSFWMFSGNENEGSNSDNLKKVVQPKEPMIYPIIFTPKEATFLITAVDDDGETKEFSSTPLKLFGNERILIQAESDIPIYGSIDKEYSFSELAELGWSVQLPELTSDEVRKRCDDLVDSGNREEANKLFQVAAEHRAELVRNSPSTLAIESVSNIKSLVSVSSNRFVGMHENEVYAWRVDKDSAVPLETRMVEADPEALIKVMRFSDEQVLLFGAQTIQLWNHFGDDDSCKTVWRSKDDERDSLYWNMDAIELSADRSLLAAATSFDEKIHFWKINDEEFTTGDLENFMAQAMLVGDGMISVLSEESTARYSVTELADRMEWDFTLNETVTQAVHLNSDKAIFATETETYALDKFPTASPELKRFDASVEPLFLRVENEGKLLLIAGRVSGFEVWDAERMERVWQNGSSQPRLADAQFDESKNRLYCLYESTGIVEVVQFGEQTTRFVLHSPKTIQGNSLFGKFLRLSDDGDSLMVVYQGELANSKSTPLIIQLGDFELDLSFHLDSVE